MLNIVFIDSELETIPEKLLNDREVTILAKKRKKPAREILLDSSILHRVIDRSFPGESSRRGRPDIFYIALNVIQSSILNLKGKVRTYIHTRNSELISISPETRIPKSFNRFQGLIEDLFKKREISSDGNVLLKIEKLESLDQFLHSLGGRIILLHPNGKTQRVDQVLKADDSCTVVIGGFSNGDFTSNIEFIKERYSIFQEELTIWTVASMIISQYERLTELT